jgi:carboxyl-terminal processing protease
MGFPDVCLTPAAPVPLPIPYPNIAMHAMAVPTCPTILNMMMPALNMASVIPLTMGDNAGVANPVFMQLGTFTMGSPKVLLQGMPAITLTSMTTGNAMNNPVGAVLVPGAPTILYGLASPAREAEARMAAPAVAAAPATGHVRIAVFTPDVPRALHLAIGELKAAGATRIVLDLRGNPGGDVHAAVEALRDMLPEGAPVASLVDVDGDAVEYRARGDACGLEIEVQVDAGTASAAELFAGSLQANGRARLVGTRTYGKGVVRAVAGDAFVDVGRFRLPGGREVDGAGVEPDEVASAGLAP